MQASDLIKTVTVGGEDYRIAMCSAEDQRKILFRLGKYGLEPALREISLAMIPSEALANRPVEMVPLAIVGTMISRMPEDDFNLICDKVLQKAQKVGEQRVVTLNDFTGRMQLYTQLAVAALGVNFADFSQFLSLFKRSTGTVETQEPSENSTQESTGSSGDPA